MKLAYSNLCYLKNDVYYVTIIDPYIPQDKYIAEKLGLSLYKYQKILKSFGAEKKDNEMIFRQISDCEKALNYLNETYGILLVLLGD
jgi:hypothetical protein